MPETIDKIEMFIWRNDEKNINFSENKNFNYLALINNSNTKFTISVSWIWIEWNIFAICFWEWEVLAEIETSINSSNSRVNVFILSLLQDDNTISISWDIKISKNLENSQWHLLEKNLILWKKIKIKATPRLDVYSSNVQATHGVSIDTFDSDKLFYLKSRGLDKNQSLELSISWYIENILDKFKSINENEKNKIEKLILSTIKIND